MTDHQKKASVCIVMNGNNLLVLKRADGCSYHNKWCLPGGRAENSETAVETMFREVEEETGCVIRSMEYAGMLHGIVEGETMEYLSVYFVSRDFEGEPRDSDEGAVEWMNIADSLSAADMHPIYRLLMPRIISRDIPVEGVMRMRDGEPPDYLLLGPGARPSR